MKTKILTVLLCFLTIIGFAKDANKWNYNYENYKYEKKKVIDTDFEVIDNALLNIIGKYGDINISCWDKNNVSFHIEIIAKANKESVVNDLLNSIDIEFTTKNADNLKKSFIKAKTIFKESSFKKVSFSVDYYVMVPKTILMELSNKYGDIHLDKAFKDLIIDLKYGDFVSDSLFANNNINIKYGNINVNYVNNFTLSMKYGGIEVKYIDVLNGTLAYSDFSCDYTSKANIISSYTDIKFKKVHDLTIHENYGDIIIHDLIKNLNVNSNYGEIVVKNINKDFNNIKLSGDYIGIYLYMIKDTSIFSFDINVNYSSFKDDFGIFKTFSKQSKDDKNIVMIGNVYDKDGLHKITINGDYLDIVIGE